jgi:hypothetical protein
VTTRFEYQGGVCTDVDRDDREVVSVIVRAGYTFGHRLSSSNEARPLSLKNDGADPLSAAISFSLISGITGKFTKSSIGTHSTAI